MMSFNPISHLPAALTCLSTKPSRSDTRATQTPVQQAGPSISLDIYHNATGSGRGLSARCHRTFQVHSQDNIHLPHALAISTCQHAQEPQVRRCFTLFAPLLLWWASIVHGRLLAHGILLSHGRLLSFGSCSCIAVLIRLLLGTSTTHDICCLSSVVVMV